MPAYLRKSLNLKTAIYASASSRTCSRHKSSTSKRAKGNNLSSIQKGSTTIMVPKPITPGHPAGFPFLVTILNPRVQGDAFKFNYLKFRWDFLAGTVDLTGEARQQCLQDVESALAALRQPVADREPLSRVIQHLVHASHIIPEGRYRLQSLVSFITPDNSHDPAVPNGLIKGAENELLWWKDRLDSKSKSTEIDILSLRSGMAPTEIYTDASIVNGRGIWIDGKWLQEGWTEGPAPDINWAEARAVELAVGHLLSGEGTKGSHFLIFSDSTAVVDGWARGGSKNSMVHSVLFKILGLLVRSDSWMSLVWIPSSKNKADLPLRAGNGLKAENRIKLDCMV